MSAVTVIRDWKNPDADYARAFAARVERYQRLRSDPRALSALELHYSANPEDFIADWMVTSDPRHALLSPPRMVVMPFILFDRQREWVRWVLERVKAREPGITEKSRDCGISWTAMALAVTLCRFNRNLTILFGSAKEDKVDRSGDPDCLFFKGRMILQYLPPELRGKWKSAHMRLTCEDTQSAIVGEAGDNIGRGGRSAIAFIDEAAHLERPELIEASLASNTDCRIDISSVRGMDNPFARKRHSGKIKVFQVHWRSDPRKGPEWYAKMAETLDPVTLAAEVDLDYRSSVEGVVIPSAWVQSSVDAHIALKIQPSGTRRAGLDVSDEGKDANSIALRHGILLEHIETWSGKGSDIYATTIRAFDVCDQHRYLYLFYDADGLGAGIRGDARIVNEARAGSGRPKIAAAQFHGSGAVINPDRQAIPGTVSGGRLNRDMFANLKAQSWWSLRRRFEQTWRALRGLPYQPDDLISIPSTLPELAPLLMELSQPTYRLNNAGKILVEKQPDGAMSPNRADAVNIAFNPQQHAVEMWTALGR